MTSTRKHVVLVHFRRAGVPGGRPWTVHHLGQCIPAATVRFEVASETIFQPKKKANPRAWIRALGRVDVDARGNVVIR